MATKILHVRLKVQIEDEPPQELIETYIKGFTKSPDKAYKRLKEALPDVEAVIEKIIKPAIKGSQALFKPDASTTTGAKIKDSYRISRAEMEKWALKYFKKEKHAYRYKGKEYAEIMEVMSGLWGKKMLSVLAITGYQDKIRGVGPIVAEWLTGVLTVVNRVSPEEIIKGDPIDITKPGQGGKFRNRFNSQIIKFGSPIIANKYQPDDIIYANEHINRLVNAYARDEFVPFTPGGASHVDFIMVDGALFLDVQVSIK